jgi:hypothetical protein
MTVADDLNRLMQTHDAAPEAAASRLRVLATQPLAADLLGRFSWLVTHVIGEKQSHWQDAHLLISEAISPHTTLPLPVLRNAAVVAYLSGQFGAATALEYRMTRQGLRSDQAAMAVRTAALSFLSQPERAFEVSLGLHTVLDGIAAWDQRSEADSMIAASLNNIVSTLMEFDDATVNRPEVREAILEGAQASRTLWQRAGTWINYERADYLVALASNRLGLHAPAIDAAEHGLHLIDANGVEDVDRAFLLLEVVQAQRGLGRDAEAAAHFALADKLASTWDDASLTEWYTRKSALLRPSAP